MTPFVKNILDALENHTNGLTEDVWLNILHVVGSNDECTDGKFVTTFNGMYYLRDEQAKRLLHIIPFLSGDAPTPREQLSLPLGKNGKKHAICSCCKTQPYLPETGHDFGQGYLSCAQCFHRFLTWKLGKYYGGRKQHRPTKGEKKLKKRQEKAESKAARERKKLAKLVKHFEDMDDTILARLNPRSLM